jgi:hypothetical protein
MIEKIPVGYSAFENHPAGVPEYFLIVKGDIDRGAIQKGQQPAGCQEKEKRGV